jgi:hypothetical protein
MNCNSAARREIVLDVEYDQDIAFTDLICRRSFRSLLPRDAAIDLGRELHKGIRNLHRIRCVPFQAPQTLGQALQLAGCVCPDLGKRRLRLNSLPGPHHRSQ